MGDGDETGNIKPWMGAIKEPKEHPPVNPMPPDEQYAIEFVYGYRSEDVRQNLFYNWKRRPVYMTAAMGIIFDPGYRKQVIFGGGEAIKMNRKQLDTSLEGHTDDIMCLTMDSSKKLVATGQVGTSPYIFIWDSVTA